MRNFTVKVFGMLGEKMPSPEFEFPYQKDSEELLKALKKEYPQLDTLNFSLAIDKQVIREKTGLNGNEEIALLPPFSGG